VIPENKTIAGLALLLPEEVRAQKLAEQEYDDEYDEEDYGDYGDEDYGEDDDYVEEKEDAQPVLTEEQNVEKIRKIMDAEDQNAVEDEDSYDSYDPDEYDDNGNYIWGKEGEDWEFYYEEDK
jgi:hypothetical protein